MNESYHGVGADLEQAYENMVDERDASETQGWKAETRQAFLDLLRLKEKQTCWKSARALVCMPLLHAGRPERHLHRSLRCYGAGVHGQGPHGIPDGFPFT